MLGRPVSVDGQLVIVTARRHEAEALETRTANLRGHVISHGALAEVPNVYIEVVDARRYGIASESLSRIRRETKNCEVNVHSGRSSAIFPQVEVSPQSGHVRTTKKS